MSPNSTKARKLRTRAARYTIIDNVLFKKVFSLPLFKCLTKNDARYTLIEVHEGVYGNHTRGQSLAHNILRQGYFWPSLKKIPMNSSENATNAKDLSPSSELLWKGWPQFLAHGPSQNRGLT
ncbi:Uncharacterized protein Adt_04174 [Abeliophyllum distichum]|uniref:Integrase zinc-binding domain-containing protein n=1 Tax=Abeliophyllum distichum TaxID=126358 RepID=A0ABD1QFN4_9LAMI